MFALVMNGSSSVMAFSRSPVRLGVWADHCSGKASESTYKHQVRCDPYLRR